MHDTLQLHPDAQDQESGHRAMQGQLVQLGGNSFRVLV